MIDINALLNNDLIFVYFITFIIVLTLLYELLTRMRLFDKKVSMLVAVIITLYVFLTEGYRIINVILSLSTVGMVILFGILIVLIMISRFWKRAEIHTASWRFVG